MKSNVLEESGPAVEGLLDARLDPEPDYISNHCKINQSGRHPLTPDQTMSTVRTNGEWGPGFN